MQIKKAAYFQFSAEIRIYQIYSSSTAAEVQSTLLRFIHLSVSTAHSSITQLNMVEPLTWAVPLTALSLIILQPTALQCMNAQLSIAFSLIIMQVTAEVQLLMSMRKTAISPIILPTMEEPWPLVMR